MFFINSGEIDREKNPSLRQSPTEVKRGGKKYAGQEKRRRSDGKNPTLVGEKRDGMF